MAAGCAKKKATSAGAKKNNGQRTANAMDAAAVTPNANLKIRIRRRLSNVMQPADALAVCSVSDTCALIDIRKPTFDPNRKPTEGVQQPVAFLRVDLDFHLTTHPAIAARELTFLEVNYYREPLSLAQPAF